MKDIIIYRNKYLAWILLFILLELLPASSEFLERQKRQIVFPGDEYDNRDPSIPCVTPDRRAGTCIDLTSCPVLMRITNYNRLRRFFCGFDGDEPQVCCPGSSRQGTTRTTRTTRRPTPTVRTIRTRRPVTPTRTTPTRRPLSVRPNTPQGGNNGNMPPFLPQECGVSMFPKTRVVGGKESEKGGWPWMVVVYVRRRGSWIPDCGGALVSNQHVITAAHCVVSGQNVVLRNNLLKVRLGEHDLYSSDDGMNPVEVDVSTVTRHENYNPVNYQNDIAVLKLTRPVEFNSNIRPICLPYNALNNEDLTDRKAFVAGWGTTSFNGPSSPVLREAMFEIHSEQTCKDAYRAELLITDIYLCAGKLDGTKDSCQGDSGGPLMSIGNANNKNRFYLVGVVSFGKYCATPGYPGVYTRVTKYLDWLRPLLSS